jgi:hypothetical protein
MYNSRLCLVTADGHAKLVGRILLETQKAAGRSLSSIYCGGGVLLGWLQAEWMGSDKQAFEEKTRDTLKIRRSCYV